MNSSRRVTHFCISAVLASSSAMRLSSSRSMSASVFFCQAKRASAAALAMLTQYCCTALGCGAAPRPDLARALVRAWHRRCAAAAVPAWATCGGLKTAAGALLAPAAPSGRLAPRLRSGMVARCGAHEPRRARASRPTVFPALALRRCGKSRQRATTGSQRDSAGASPLRIRLRQLCGGGLIAPPGPPAARRPT